MTMGAERAKLRPFPRTEKQWAREVDGIKRFLSRLTEWEPAFGSKWAERMEDYYKGRLAYLMERGSPSKRKRK